jgi:hypothetical protein
VPELFTGEGEIPLAGEVTRQGGQRRHPCTATGEGQGLIGHAGAVLLRKLADQAGLTAALGSALTRRGKLPLVDRGSTAARQPATPPKTGTTRLVTDLADTLNHRG